jgi:hypothetical protein
MGDMSGDGCGLQRWTHVCWYDIDHALVEDVAGDLSELPIPGKMWGKTEGDLGFPEARTYLFFLTLYGILVLLQFTHLLCE